MLLQTVITPKRDWRADAELRVEQLKRNRDTVSQRVFEFPGDDYTPDPSFEDADPTHRDRTESIRAADPKHSFVINVRAVAAGLVADSILREIGNAFRPVSGPFYEIIPRVLTDTDDIDAALEKLSSGVCVDRQPRTTRLKQRLPVTANTTPAIVADSSTGQH